LFETVFLRRRSPWRSVVFSAGGHLAAGYFVVAYSAFIAAHPVRPAVDLNAARILELDVDKLLPYVPPDIPRPQVLTRSTITAPPVPHSAITAPAAPSPRPSAEPQPEIPAPANPIPAPKIPRTFTPPPLQVADAPKIAKAPETLIQLDIPKPEVQTQLQVPNALILTNSPRRFLPRPVIRPPQLDKQAVPAAVVDMDLPRIQSSVGDLAIARSLTDHASLPVRPTSKAPLSGTSPTPAEIATGNWKSEEAPALVALPDIPIPNHTAVVVPPAVQMGAKGPDTIQAAPPAPGGGGGTGTSRAQSAQTASNINPSPSTGTSPTNSTAPPSPAKAPGPPTTAPAPAAPTAPAPSDAPASRTPGTAPQPGAALPEVARVTMPRDGNYEVVVTQNAGIIPHTTDYLRGRPVYSVYLKVGARKDWILQYSLPAEAEAAKKNSTIVRLGDSPTIGAPYAFTMLRPDLTFAAADVRYAMIHGVINKDGHFEQLNEVADHALKNLPELMQALAGWEFRPATKDGAPVAVEVLLCIPNTSR
jgi:hypothetical protein